MLDEILESKKYVFCYFDLIGTSNKVYKCDGCVSYSLWRICTVIDKYIEHNKNIKIKNFSDNFVIAIESNDIDKEKHMNELVSIIGEIYADCMSYFECYLRGVIMYGDLNIQEDFLIGTALVDAYKMESNNVVFPRILIDENSFILDKRVTLEDNKKYYVDIDGKVVVNQLACKDIKEIKEAYNSIYQNLIEETETEEYINNTNVFIKIDYLFNYVKKFGELNQLNYIKK